MLSMAPRRGYESSRLLARADRDQVGEEFVAGHVEDHVNHREVVAARDRVASFPALDAAPARADQEPETVLGQVEFLAPSLNAAAECRKVHSRGG